ncbi:hypothetical protein [Sphingomonas sp. VNH70]|uniref:hypothetical protein n=1 Tax=Sphingomonas silueang TaxID=3156617 RepID=UPI0032B5DBB7
MRRLPVLALPFALLLAGCGDGDAPAAGGVSESEAAALNDAAAMLDANALSAETVNSEAKE